MNIPSEQEIIDLYEKYNVLENIKKHMMSVANFAEEVAIKLNSKGYNLNVELIKSGAALHDIAKHLCLETDKRHCKEGAKIIENEGYPEVSEFARVHSGDAILEGKWNELDLMYKIMCYVDAKVLQNNVVSLDERFTYLFMRYPRIKKKLILMKKAYEDFEKEYLD